MLQYFPAASVGWLCTSAEGHSLSVSILAITPFSILANLGCYGIWTLYLLHGFPGR